MKPESIEKIAGELAGAILTKVEQKRWRTPREHKLRYIADLVEDSLKIAHRRGVAARTIKSRNDAELRGNFPPNVVCWINEAIHVIADDHGIISLTMTNPAIGKTIAQRDARREFARLVIKHVVYKEHRKRRTYAMAHEVREDSGEKWEACSINEVARMFNAHHTAVMYMLRDDDKLKKRRGVPQ